MYIKKSLVILLLFINLILVAQEIRIPDSIFATYNNKGIISLFTEKKYYEVDISNYEISEPIYFEKNKFNIQNYTPIKLDSAYYFINNSGGTVLKLKGNKLTQIDNSYNHKMQLGSTIFKYNNEIYRYGGYGFFSSRSFILRYDGITNEWESIVIKNSKVPEARYDNSFLLKNDQFAIIGGKNVDPLNRQNRVDLNDYWQFSFKDRSWDKIVSSEYFKSFSSFFFETKKGIGTIEKNKAYIFNNENSTLQIHNLNPILLKYEKKFKIYFYNDLFHFIARRNNNEIILMSRTHEELFGTSITSEFINNYKKNTLRVIIALVIFSIISLLTLSIHQYFFCLIITPGKIRYRNYKINLSQEENYIFQEFNSNHQIIENNKLQKILDKEQYDRSNNIRLKNKFIIELNSKLQYLFNNDIKNYIQIQQSSFDKRYKRYFLNLENIKLTNKTKPSYRRYIYLFLLLIIFIILCIEFKTGVFEALITVS
jgi:hypothetical protein